MPCFADEERELPEGGRSPIVARLAGEGEGEGESEDMVDLEQIRLKLSRRDTRGTAELGSSSPREY